MDNIYATAVRIAEKVAPQEVDVAPAVIDAALEGGRQWNDLLRPAKGPELGGAFGGIETGDLTIVFDTLRHTSQLLFYLCATVSSTLTVIMTHKTLRERKEQIEKMKSVPVDEKQKVEEAISAMEKHLVELGVPAERAQELSRLTILALLEDPEGSKEFLARLSKKG